MYLSSERCVFKSHETSSTSSHSSPASSENTAPPIGEPDGDTMTYASSPSLAADWATSIPAELHREWDYMAVFCQDQSSTESYIPSSDCEAPSTVRSAYSASPALSYIGSNRSSISSPASEFYSQSEPYCQVQESAIKMENHLDWSLMQTGGRIQDANPQFPVAEYGSQFDYTTCPQNAYAIWDMPTINHQSQPPVAVQQPQPNIVKQGSTSQRPPSPKAQEISIRTKPPRKMTTLSDANFQCNFPDCGKLFNRSYNYKAHLQTHCPTREHAYACDEAGCGKKFVRRTDLVRHCSSVHEKARAHRCGFCSRHFARKDTLRRHMEDGCPKRGGGEKVTDSCKVAGDGGEVYAPGTGVERQQQQQQQPPPQPQLLITDPPYMSTELSGATQPAVLFLPGYDMNGVIFGEHAPSWQM